METKEKMEIPEPNQIKSGKKKKKRVRASIPVPKEKETVDAWWILKDKKESLEEKQDKLVSITLKFVTKQEQYAIPQSSIAVKEDTDTDGLNNIVFSILEKTGMLKYIPSFEFMIEGKLLVSTIGQHLTELRISFEATTSVEYFERFPPPTPKDKLEHDDWVSSVMSCGSWLVTGCYDNTVQLWSTSGMLQGVGKKAHKLTIPAHKAPVKAVAWINTEDRIKSFASCSIDQSAIVWDWDSINNSVECVWECRGHSQSVECLSVYAKENRFATGSWDNTIKIWDTGSIHHNSSHEKEPDNKKLKKSKQERLRTPMMTLAGHSESVSGVDWMDSAQLLSCSWDHSIRVWDIEIGGMSSQISGNVAFFCLSYSKQNRLLLAGCADRNIRLYDPRSNEGNLVLNKYVSNKKWVPSIRWSGNNDNLFVSGCYDNTVRVWDKRSSTNPLYCLFGHRDKIFSVDWSHSSHIVSGSADCSAQIYMS